MKTINVIEHNGETITNLKAFEDNETGNKAAEKIFRRYAKANGANRNQVNFHLDNGFYSSGDYTVFLVHSS